jgi:histidinol-phosphate phosphatase family protein
VFVDRDGTLIPDFHYLTDPDRVEILKGVTSGIRRLREAGFAVVCVTNQSGIARKLYTEETVRRIHERIQQKLNAGGGSLDGLYFCPHAPEAGCACRKPGTLLFTQAREELGLEFRGSAIVGDRWLDMEVGRTLGLFSVLVPELGREVETEAEFVPGRALPAARTGDFAEAADRILERG